MNGLFDTTLIPALSSKSLHEQLLSMVACLTPEEPVQPEQIEMLRSLGFIRQSVPVSLLPDILNCWQEGAITLSGMRLSTDRFSEPTFSPFTSGQLAYVSACVAFDLKFNGYFRPQAAKEHYRQQRFPG